MPRGNWHLILYQKTAKRFEFAVPLQPGQSVAKAYLMIKVDQADADGSAVVSKSITATAGATGAIIDDGSSGTAILRFELLVTDLDSITTIPAVLWLFVKIILASGEAQIVSRESTVVEVRAAEVGAVT